MKTLFILIALVFSLTSFAQGEPIKTEIGKLQGLSYFNMTDSNASINIMYIEDENDEDGFEFVTMGNKRTSSRTVNRLIKLFHNSKDTSNELNLVNDNILVLNWIGTPKAANRQLKMGYYNHLKETYFETYTLNEEEVLTLFGKL